MANEKDLHRKLSGLNLSELKVIAKRLDLSGFSRMKKEELVLAIAHQDDPQNIRKAIIGEVIWWDRYHNHVYGAFTIAAFFLAIFSILSRAIPCQLRSPKDRAASPLKKQPCLDSNGSSKAQQSNLSK